MIKLLNEVGTRLPPRIEEQPDFFASYSIPTTIFIQSNEGDKRGVHIPVVKATIYEVETWIEMHGKPRMTKPTKVVEMERLIADIKPFAVSESSTVSDALKASKTDERRAAS